MTIVSRKIMNITWYFTQSIVLGYYVIQYIWKVKFVSTYWENIPFVFLNIVVGRINLDGCTIAYVLLQSMEFPKYLPWAVFIEKWARSEPFIPSSQKTEQILKEGKNCLKNENIWIYGVIRDILKVVINLYWSRIWAEYPYSSSLNTNLGNHII